MADTTNKKINITTEFFVKNADAMMNAMNKNNKVHNKTQADMQKRNVTWQQQSKAAQASMSKGLAKQSDSSQLANNMNKGFFNTLFMGQKQYQKSQLHLDSMTKVQKKSAPASHRAAMGLRKATHGMRGFRMEMLGVMFFGMAMQRFFGGLMKTALEWSGIMDILSITLGVIFLPVVLQLTEMLIPVATWFMNLSESTRLWIGWIVILGFVIGTALMVIGMMALGLGSLIGMMTGATFAGIIGAFAGIALAIGLVILSMMVLKGFFGGLDKEFDDSVSNWQANGGKLAKIMGFIVRFFTIGGAIMSATFGNAISLILIAVNQMAKGITIAVVGTINFFIKLWNWIKKVAARGGSYSVTEKMVANTGAFDAIIANQEKKIADRSVDLLLNTPTLGNLLTGEQANPETPVDNRTNAEKRGEVSTGDTNITNNYNGFSNEDLLKELDARDAERASQMERNR